MNPLNSENKNIKPKENEFIFETLKKIEADIDRMGNSLKEMCVFLDKLSDFKKEAEKPIATTHDGGVFAEITSSDNLTEINEENMRLFENTEIDKVLPQGDEKQ